MIVSWNWLNDYVPLKMTQAELVEQARLLGSATLHEAGGKKGALIGGGIGCHSMVLMMEPERVGNIVGLTSMGNEGAQWFGMSPFVDDEHIIQNIGDGTLFHSGMTAIRAAIASGTNITYKILYNGAVAMTGGQDPFGQLDVIPLVNVLLGRIQPAHFPPVFGPAGNEPLDRNGVAQRFTQLAAQVQQAIDVWSGLGCRETRCNTPPSEPDP